MKVAELEGALLDYWVARAEGHPLSAAWNCTADGGILIGTGNGDLERFSPSTDWAQAGPIIDREGIQISPPDRPVHRFGGRAPGWGDAGDWAATIFRSGAHRRMVLTHKTSPLIAAMRAYVASKFGEDVPDAPAP